MRAVLASVGGLLVLAGPAAAETRTPLCAALADLAAQVASSGQPAEVVLLKPDAMSVDCTGEARFCAAAIDAAGAQFTHRYGWELRACLGWGPSVTIEENLKAHTGVGRNRIDHMAARLPGGVRLDLRFLPERREGEPTDPKDPMYGYYGRYRLSLWKP